MKNNTLAKLLFVKLIIGSFLIDQLTKFLARTYLNPNEIVPLIPNLLDLILIQNKGVSYGFLANLTEQIRLPLLTILPILIIIVINIFVILNWKKIDFLAKLGWAIIVGGALGNVFDRIILKSVTDFMHFRFFETSFFINNLADDFISIGLVFVIIKDLKKRFINNNPKKY